MFRTGTSQLCASIPSSEASQAVRNSNYYHLMSEDCYPAIGSYAADETYTIAQGGYG